MWPDRQKSSAKWLDTPSHANSVRLEFILNEKGLKKAPALALDLLGKALG